MLSDVVSPSSYLTFNVTIAHIIGLTNAVYCAELLDIFSKARRKQTLDENQFFIVDRSYIKFKTAIKEDDQYLCDACLSSAGLLKTSENNPDKIKFDVEMFMRIIAEDDAKELDKVSKKINLPKNKTNSKKLKKEKLKSLLSKDNIYIHDALVKWLDCLIEEGKYVRQETIKDFQTALFNYAGSDVQKALDVIDKALSQGWTTCSWAIKAYEDDKKNDNSVRTTKLKIASPDNLSDKRY